LSTNITLHVLETDQGIRLDKYVADKIDEVSRAKVLKLIQDSAILVNGANLNPSYRLKSGDIVKIEINESLASNLDPWDFKIDVIYEDESILVINKPSGIAVHPAPGHLNKTIANALIFNNPDISQIGASSRPGIIHRLDLETSGLMVTAKTDLAHRKISHQFAERTVKKVYLALVDGIPKESEAVIDAPIGRSPFNRQHMDIVSTGKASVTQYQVIETYPAQSLLKVFPKTGRTHQIRVHLKSIGHTVLGDHIYGKREKGLNRQFLHASSLEFYHPVSNQAVTFESKLPLELTQYLESLKSSINMKDTA